MSRAQLKEALIRHIDQADESFLQVVYAMMEAYAEQKDGVVGYRPKGMK